MGEPTKTNTTAGLVSSGSGQSINAKAVAAGDFAYGALGNGTAGGMGNAALLSTTTILPNTQRTNISKSQLEAADKEYTKQMNLLSNFWTQGDTKSPSYQAQKQNALTSQYQWELARNNLEEVVARDLSDRITPADISAELPVGPMSVDLDDLASGISPDLVASDDEVDGPDIVVTAKKPKDSRVRFQPLDGNKQEIYGEDTNSPLFLLNETNGVFFPYTPTVDFSHKAEYSSMSPTHANTSYFTYNHTPAVQITITGQFSAQNLAEARYTLAAMHFFRTVTKMHFGEKAAIDGSAGLPPPVLLLSGYGNFMLNDLKVVVQEFKMDLPNNVDYIEVNIGESVAWVPSLTTFTVSCVVQNTPKEQRVDFNFKEFANGSMFSNEKGWI